MRCRQVNVEIRRSTNLWPALWNKWHQMLLETSIKGMKCSILKWHNRAKIWVPTGVATLDHLGFANNKVMVSL